MWLSGGFDMSRIPEEMCQHTEEKQHPSIVGGFGCVCSNLFSTAALASRPVPFMFICTTYHMYGSAIPRVTSKHPGPQPLPEISHYDCAGAGV